MSAAKKPPAPVRVTIDVLSLSGLSAQGVSRMKANAIGASLQTELSRLLGQADLQARLRAGVDTRGVQTSLDAGRLRLRPGDRAERVGARIAGHVVNALVATPGRRGHS